MKTIKMDIYEINTKEIIDQYLEYIHKAENMNIDIASEYLVMAAELIHLKSKLLVNKKKISINGYYIKQIQLNINLIK